MDKIYFDFTNATNITKLCRICLTQSKYMNSLVDRLEKTYENEVNFLYEALFRVTSERITINDSYPISICAICTGLLNIAYKFKIDFEKSQKLLRKYTNEPITSLSPKLNKKVPVEIISKKGSFDINDLIIIEEDNENKETFDGFLKNLGNEVNAYFIRDKGKKKISPDEYNISITKMVYTKPIPDNTMKIKQLTHETKTNETELTETSITDLLGNSEYTVSKEQCPHCGKFYSNKKNLKRHINDIHLKIQAQNCLCQLCGETFQTKSGLKNHNIFKHGEKKFKCKICGKKYFTNSHLKIHEAVHKNERLYLCTICGRNFNYANALEYHSRIHSGEKRYQCMYCDRTFRMKCGLNRHIRTHTGVRPYKCRFCEKAFFSRGEVTCHEMLHTGNRPYYCHLCNKGFTKSHNLKVHLLNHKGPHMCDVCSKGFIDVNYLKMHIKTMHEELEVIT